MFTLKRLIGFTLIVLFTAACSSSPAVPNTITEPPTQVQDVNPVGLWTGQAVIGASSQVITMDLGVSTVNGYPGQMSFLVSGTILTVRCQVSGASMQCSAQDGGGTSAFLNGSVTDSSFSGQLRVSFGGESLIGTFTLAKSL